MNDVSVFIQKISKFVRFRWLPWIILAVTLLFALLHEILRPPWVVDLSREGQAVYWALALVGLVLIYIIADRVIFFIEQRDQLQKRVEIADGLVLEDQKRLRAIFRISQKYVNASDENEVIDLVLKLSLELVGAKGVSYVPLDEHGQPLAALSYGELPAPGMSDWVEYLATPAVRNRCKNCENLETLLESSSCPLFKGPFSEASELFCLPLRRGEHEFGVLNLFFSNPDQIDAETREFLKAMIDETSMALEGARLRQRELAALRQMQVIREKTDIKGLLSSLLEEVQQSLESDFAMLILKESGDGFLKTSIGNFPNQALPFLEGVLQGVVASGSPVMFGDLFGQTDSEPGLKSILAAPLKSGDGPPAGALLVGSRRQEVLHQRQLAVLQTVAGQVALIIQNANLVADIEFKTMIQERTRLAREIHDGLAQTLGFLKLTMGQMQNYLERREFDHLRKSIDLCYSTLNEAYLDVRQAIDGLRIWPTGNNLSVWLEQTIEEFKEISELNVVLEPLELSSELPPEVHAQLMRIVQEALSNVRKHADATHVWISFREVETDLWLEIRDNGAGFAPEDVTGPSQHGLRGMRERADLIGADFQIISCPTDGTVVRVRLPLVGLQTVDSGESGK